MKSYMKINEEWGLVTSFHLMISPDNWINLSNLDESKLKGLIISADVMSPSLGLLTQVLVDNESQFMWDKSGPQKLKFKLTNGLTAELESNFRIRSGLTPKFRVPDKGYHRMVRKVNSVSIIHLSDALLKLLGIKNDREFAVDRFKVKITTDGDNVTLSSNVSIEFLKSISELLIQVSRWILTNKLESRIVKNL